MKKVLRMIACVVITLSLTACSTVDLNTPKSEELKSQYSFYEKSVAEIRTEMKITPEQSDEVFIALVSIGVDDKVYHISKKLNSDNTYNVYYTGGIGSLEVDVINNAVAEIRRNSDVLYPVERTADYLNAQAIDRVTKLIENLNNDSTIEECKEAQSAFDELSKDLKKQISDNLVGKLEYKTIVMSENLPQYYGSYKEAQTFSIQFEKGIVSTDSYSFSSDVTILSIDGYWYTDEINGIELYFKNADVSLDFEEAKNIMNKFLPIETISRYYDEPEQELHIPTDKNESSYITTCYSLNEDGKKVGDLNSQIGIIYEIKNNVCVYANIGFGSPTRGLNTSNGYCVTNYPPNESTDINQTTTAESTVISEPETSKVEYPIPSVSESAQTELSSAVSVENNGNWENHFNDYYTPEQQNTTQIVLNTSTKKYHYPSCSEVAKIKPENYATIGSEAEAIAQGYTACKRCH